MLRARSNSSTTMTGKAEDSRFAWTDTQTLAGVTKVALVPMEVASAAVVDFKEAMVVVAAEEDLVVEADSEVDLAVLATAADEVDMPVVAALVATLAILAAHKNLLLQMHSLTLPPAAASEVVSSS